MFFVSVSDEMCQHEQAHSAAILVANVSHVKPEGRSPGICRIGKD
jgi:hypothetical protein